MSTDLRNKLEKEHVLYTFIDEHELLSNLLHKLEKEAQIVKNSSDYDSVSKNIENISILIDKIISAEPHHKREEDVLFPLLQERGFIQPPKIMVMEHVGIRKYNTTIKKLAEECNKENFTNNIKELIFNIEQMVSMLIGHIVKENTILYPAALKFIKEKEKWQEMKIKCDFIGYSNLEYN